MLGVDTIVLVDEQVLGKPADESEAARMLALLAGREHRVISGLTLRDDAGERTAHARDRGALPSARRRGDRRLRRARRVARPRRVRTRSRSRARRSSSGIEGDFFNVVGLPVALLVEMLSERRSPVSG